MFFQSKPIKDESMCPYTGELFRSMGKIVITSTLISVEGLHSIDEDKRAAGQSEHEIEGSKADIVSQNSKRSSITEFTRASQVRFIKTLSMWDPQNQLVIVTLTYPKEFPTTEVANKHFVKFRKKLMRDNPDWCGCWKLEYQSRGAPHYHLVLDTGTEPLRAARMREIRQEVNQTWEKSRGGGFARTQVDKARNNEKAKYYLTKEVGKMAQASTAWRDKLDEKIEHYGRFWGWINKKKMRLASEQYYVPVQIAVLVQHKIRKRMLDDMKRRGAVSLIDGKFIYKYSGTEVDENLLPSWQLFPDATTVMNEIIDEVEAETGLKFFKLANERSIDNST